MESIVEGYREDTAKDDERKALCPMAGASVMANAPRRLFEAGMAGVNLAEDTAKAECLDVKVAWNEPFVGNPVWGTEDFKIDGSIKFVQFDGDPNCYGLSRGMWWKPVGGPGCVERVTNSNTLEKLDVWLGHRRTAGISGPYPIVRFSDPGMNNVLREKQQDAGRQQLNGAGAQALPIASLDLSLDPFDEFPDAFAILMRRAQSAASNADEDEAFAAKLEKQAHELREKAAARYLHAQALRDAASKLAPAT